MRSRSAANAALVGEGSSGRSRRALAERAAYSARLAFSRSSVCSRTRSAATERVRESFASARVCVAISRKAKGCPSADSRRGERKSKGEQEREGADEPRRQGDRAQCWERPA